MAKRFTDTAKWNKPFIRSMKAPYKLLWLYIIDECDHAGIWQVDFDVAQIKIGEKLNIETAIKSFAGKIHIFDDGQKWFIPDFIDFQYGELNKENRAHNSVLTILKKYSLLEIKPLASPLKGAMDKDKDRELVIELDENKEPPKEKTKFELTFDAYLEMRKKIKKPATEHAIDLLHNELEKLSKGNEQMKIAILEQSIKNSYQGLFELKQPTQTNKPIIPPYSGTRLT